MRLTTNFGTEPRSDPWFQDNASSYNSIVFDILLENILNTIITKALKERF